MTTFKEVFKTQMNYMSKAVEQDLLHEQCKSPVNKDLNVVKFFEGQVFAVKEFKKVMKKYTELCNV